MRKNEVRESVPNNYSPARFFETLLDMVVEQMEKSTSGSLKHKIMLGIFLFAEANKGK